MLESDSGIILNETPFNENSKILQVLTPKHGLISLIAKNAKSLKSPLRATTQKFTYGLFNFNYKENKISNLISVDIIDNFTTIKSDLTLISYLTYLCDLTYQVAKVYGEKELFFNLIGAIKKIESGLDPLIITNVLEIKYLDYLGVGLNLDTCVKCGSRKNIVTINSLCGGYICQNCYNHEYIVSPKTIKLIREYYYVDINSITKTKISPLIKQEINKFLDGYYDSYTGLYLKSKEFLNKMLNMS